MDQKLDLVVSHIPRYIENSNLDLLLNYFLTNSYN